MVPVDDFGLVRIDDRLIHGQVIAGWIKHLRFTRIVILDDEVAANLGDVCSAYACLEYGAEGVGLLRTEFLFMDRTIPPGEEEQYRAYLAIAAVMGQRPLVIRTLDVGGDKPLPYLEQAREANPFLGCRGIRVSLAHPQMLRTQLRAILRASAGHNIKVMFPMVTTLDEIRAAKAMIRQAQADPQAAGMETAPRLEIGIMVEVPAAAILSDLWAPKVDFFSVETNDLIQYTLAVDRGSPKVAAIYDPLNPAVLRLIKMAVDAGHRHGKWVSVCGEMAGDHEALPLLVGMGLDEFSMNAAAIPAAKAQIRRLDAAAMQSLVERALMLARQARSTSWSRGPGETEVAGSTKRNPRGTPTGFALQGVDTGLYRGAMGAARLSEHTSATGDPGERTHFTTVLYSASATAACPAGFMWIPSFRNKARLS